MRPIFLVLISSLVLFAEVIHATAKGDSLPDTPDTTPLKVLFIGNSYTYVNNLPLMLSVMSDARGSSHRILTKMEVAPAATLQFLWEKGEAVKAIRATKWNFVVLQEQSVLPIVDPTRMRTYARRFDDAIKASGAKTILFLTWARRGNPNMQRDLDKAYLSLATDLQSLVAPVGPAWQIALATAPSVNLYMEDGSHPTPAGTYLAACTFFQLIEGTNQCPAPMQGSISGNDAAALNGAVSFALETWR